MEMMLLQIWGGMLYLLNKVSFSRAERCDKDSKRRSWHIASWIVYLAGLPAWLILLAHERNWMIVAVEAGGAPAMTLGLMSALRGSSRDVPKWLKRFALVSAVAGIVISIVDVGGLNQLTQVFELGCSIGFLLGTLLLAHQRRSGYLWFMLMNLSVAALMFVQGYWLLMVQQLVSLGFVIDALRASGWLPIIHRVGVQPQSWTNHPWRKIETGTLWVEPRYAGWTRYLIMAYAPAGLLMWYARRNRPEPQDDGYLAFIKNMTHEGKQIRLFRINGTTKMYLF